MNKTNMKPVMTLILCGLALPALAFAAIPKNDVTEIDAPAYGFYTTSDASCTTGWVRLFVSKTATTVNMADSATIGKGLVASPIACALMIMGNPVIMGWASGNYDSTGDGVCDSGGTSTQYVCRSGQGSYTFPSEVVTDAANAGLTLSSSGTCTGTSSDIFPVYFSVDSGCYDNSTQDASGTCGNGGGSQSNAFEPPTSSGDTAHGLKLASEVTPTTTLTFAMNPYGSVLAEHGSCQSQPPTMSIHN